MKFALKVHKADFIDYFIFFSMLLQMSILNFFGYATMMNKIIALIALVQIVRYILVLNSKYIKGPIILGMILIGLGVLISGDYNITNIQSNCMMMLYPMIYVTYIYMLCEKKPYIIDSIINKGFWVFNIIMLINFYVIYKQITEPYSITGAATSYTISYYEDTISGLFGYASTHVLCIYALFVIAYDYIYCEFKLYGLKKWLMRIYVLFIVLFNSYIAVNNDNKAFFLLLILVLVICYLLIKKKKTETKRNLKIFILILGVLVGGWICYRMIPAVTLFIDKNLFTTLKLISNAYSMGNVANGSNERIAIIGYALTQKETWLFGTGFSSTYLYASGFHGFRHFGQGDLGSILLVGGIWFLITLVMFYYNIFISIALNTNSKKDIIIKIMFFILLISIATYTQCFTRANLMFALILLVFSFRLVGKGGENENSNTNIY